MNSLLFLLVISLPGGIEAYKGNASISRDEQDNIQIGKEVLLSKEDSLRVLFPYELESRDTQELPPEKLSRERFDTWNAELVGNWPFGKARATATDSARELAFFGSGGGVYILDISDNFA